MKKKIRTGTFRRVIWFFSVNITIIFTLVYLTQGSLNDFIPFLLVYACLMPFVSLLFSKSRVKKAYNLAIIKDDYRYEETIEWYRNKVYEICGKAGMKKMPEIAVYESKDKNAFATGRSKNSSLIAVSSSLLYEMSEDAVEAVIAHEVAHIMNGDMVTQTLLQSALRMMIGVVILPITIFRWILLFMVDSENIFIYYLTLIIEFIVGTILFFISSLLVKKYSRKREFKADYMAAQLTAPRKMIKALKELDGPAILLPSQRKYSALQFNGLGRVLDVFSTHPSIQRRIKYLEKKF